MTEVMRRAPELNCPSSRRTFDASPYLLSRWKNALIALALGLGGILFPPFHQVRASSEQVIAHVRNEDVTLQELENEFRSEKVPVDQQQDRDVIKRVLSNIVLRKYLAQEAVAAKLDREPHVLLNILRSREQVLSAAVIQRHVLSNLAALSVEEYIRTNPLKFAARKAFKVDEILVPINETTQSIVDAAKHYNTLEEIEQKLNDGAVPHNRSEGMFDSGDLPQEMIERIAAHKEGILFIRSGSNAIFFKVIAEANAPLSPEQSVALARQLMERQLLDDEVRRATLLAQAQSTFEGEYAGIMGRSRPDEKQQSPSKNMTFATIWRDKMFQIAVAGIVGFAMGFGARSLQSRRRRTAARGYL